MIPEMAGKLELPYHGLGAALKSLLSIPNTQVSTVIDENLQHLLRNKDRKLCLSVELERDVAFFLLLCKVRW